MRRSTRIRKRSTRLTYDTLGGRDNNAQKEIVYTNSYQENESNNAENVVEDVFLWRVVKGWACCLVVIALAAELTQPTAYGRFGVETSEITLDPRLGWWLMELPCSSVFIITFFFVGGPQSRKPVPRLFASVYLMHYLYRGWLFPAFINRHGSAGTNFSIVPAVGSWIVTITHAYLNAKWFSTFGKKLNWEWIKSKWFFIAAATYYCGLGLTIWHDHILRNLRPCPSGQRYCVPHGALFEWITSAQYFSELVAWLGFWMMSCGPNGAFIFFVSLANLIPRSHSTHDWYLERFGDEYEDLGRYRLVPFLW